MDEIMFMRVFRGRRVLVTGHSGFKGSWLTMWLESLGAEVIGYALAPETEPALFELAGLTHRCHHILGDVRDSEKLSDVVQRVRPEVVFHLAAQPLVRRSYRQPKETFDINVGGTVNLLEAIRQTDSVRVALLITTDKVYENREWVYGYREVDPLGGHDPYSASKAAAELAIQAYLRAFFAEARSDGTRIGVASARAGNVIGGGDWAEDRIIPDAVRAAGRGEPLWVRHPHAIRPWQHVLEPLAGYLALAARLWQEPETFSGAWNFGPLPTDVMPVGELVDEFLSAYGRGEWKQVNGQDTAVHEAGLLKLACDKAADSLKWAPTWNTATAVGRAAAWYRDVLMGGVDAGTRCMEDIEAFSKDARSAGAWWAR